MCIADDTTLIRILYKVVGYYRYLTGWYSYRFSQVKDLF